MTQLQPADTDPKPPALITLILIICGLGIALDIAVSYLGFSAIYTQAKGAPSIVSTTAILVSAIIRFVGAIRLYLLRSDSWIYLLVSFLIAASATLLVYVEQTLTSQPAPSILSIVLSLVVPTVIVVYAFRATNRSPKS